MWSLVGDFKGDFEYVIFWSRDNREGPHRKREVSQKSKNVPSFEIDTPFGK